MPRIISINERGSLTLPKDLRVKYGLDQSMEIILEESTEGIVIKPSVTFPVEIYTEERLKEFEQSNEIELEDFNL
jgi:bifunctional DNA-binding transcriptional regulator/antitoxin component of YhaV-PrlF toxin-antitoxin module